MTKQKNDWIDATSALFKDPVYFLPYLFADNNIRDILNTSEDSFPVFLVLLTSVKFSYIRLYLIFVKYYLYCYQCFNSEKINFFLKKYHVWGRDTPLMEYPS